MRKWPVIENKARTVGSKQAPVVKENKAKPAKAEPPKTDSPKA